MKFLIKQATFLPLIFFIPVFVAGFLVPNYNLITQHASEITITEFEIAKLVINTGALLTGLSCIILAIGIVLNFKRHFILGTLLTVFGISMCSNGIYPMGTMMHGFYGIGLILMIIPFVACYELRNETINKLFFKVSLIVGFVIFIYMWSVLVGLDPADFRGLTQRIASVFIFGWIAYLAYELGKLLPNKE
jgi:hypothetical protein